ncbi:MAG: DinB family protein [Planctomycetota bacterium]
MTDELDHVSNSNLIAAYARGPADLANALQSVSPDEWDARPVPSQWSLRELVCHLVDSEIVYADRMKRVIAEDRPTFFEAAPDQHVPALAGSSRCMEKELALIASIRDHMRPILQACSEEQFARNGIHSLDGPMDLRTLLRRISGHIPHHLFFVKQKRKLLAKQPE